MRGNMVFFVYSVAVTSMTLPSWQRKTKLLLRRKNTPKGDITGITEKDDIHPRKLIDTLERAEETATGDVLQEKVFLEISQNSQEKTCARVFFLIKLQA